jgi:ferredoxin
MSPGLEKESKVAEKERMWEDNELRRLKPGYPVFYVDRECILCSVCQDAAPACFRLSESEDHNVVYKQPADEQELDRCLEALENCPVEAIGKDGDAA